MKNKKIIIPLIIIILLALFGFGYYYFNNEDTNSTLTLSEKTWIESNKNKIIDIGLVNEVAILNYGGEGIIFNFLQELENNTGLEFNKVSYSVEDEISEDYSFKRVEKVSKDEILVYSDNYVLVGKENKKYNNINEIEKGVIGVIEEDLANANKFLHETDNSFKAYKSISELLNAFINEESELKYIVLPKLILLSSLEEYDGISANYNITEIKDNYVIKLGDNKTLNNIIKKYFRKWESENFDDIFATQFTNMYFNIHEVDEKDKVKFRSKRYVYGFVENAPYDMEINNRLVGMNNSLIKRFSELSNVEISFQAYSNTKKLFKEFNENKIDFYFNSYSKDKFNIESYETVSTFNEQIVILSSDENNITINSEKSLANYNVVTIENSKIEKQLLADNVKVDTYKNVKKLLEKVNNDSIIVIDKITYDFYKNNKLKNYSVNYTYDLKDAYNYVIRDVKNNEVFEEFFDYFLTYVNETEYLNDGYHKAVLSKSNNSILKTIVIIIAGLVVLLILLFIGNLIKPNKPKKRKLDIKKEDKVKYIDMLTSLKNRNYLNERIEIWDESEIYPQSILIVDLNNIAYINDNYGHQEGDNVIKQAAGILITNQMPNSDIIRTNGNEFLVYMVEYDEKQVVSYIKKLNKEFKNLSHGFGAAIGYSMITDGIKTIDDAVNEATLDMRNNKEELNN